MSNDKSNITVKAIIHAPVNEVWGKWTQADHIKQWNNASPDWHTPRVENDLRVGGKFSSRMEAKDGSFGFDFGGIYNEVETHQRIVYTLDDGRQVEITFQEQDQQTQITETFEAESDNPIDMQQQGWQAILDNFKKYVEEA